MIDVMLLVTASWLIIRSSEIQNRPAVRLLIMTIADHSSGGQSTQIKYLSKSTDTYNKILLH